VCAPSLSDTKTGENVTKKVICPDPPGDLAEGVVRQAQCLGGEVQRFVIELDGGLGQRLPGLVQRVDMARARREGALARILALRQPSQGGVQFGQPLA
jgi:hypothetical protein